MNKIISLALFAIVSACAFAAAPDKIDGFVYSESEDTLPRIVNTRVIVFSAGGKFSGLFQTSTGSRVAGGYTLSSLGDGSYTYQKTDDSTAELVLSIPLSDGTVKRTLKFDSATTGRLPVSTAIFGPLSVGFRLAPAARAPLSNCSNLSVVRAGGSASTGFVVSPGVSATVLVRAVGPTLTAFGVSAPLRNPRLNVVDAAGRGMFGGTNDDWFSESAEAIRRTGAFVGAFALGENSRDSAVILSLGPGAYTAQVTSSDPTDSGDTLVEVYLLP